MKTKTEKELEREILKIISCGEPFGDSNWVCGDFLQEDIDEDGRSLGRCYYCDDCHKKADEIIKKAKEEFNKKVEEVKEIIKEVIKILDEKCSREDAEDRGMEKEWDAVNKLKEINKIFKEN